MTAAAVADTPDVLFTYLPVGRVQPDPDNPRHELGDLTELAASIREQGVLEPLLVTPDPDDQTLDGEPGRYLCVCGHRRLAAAFEAGIDAVPCVVRPDLADPALRLEVQVVENVQRANLTPLEEADAFARLEELGVKQRQIAKRIGRNQSHVSKRLSLRKLPDAAKDLLTDKRIGIETALGMAALLKEPKRLDSVLDYVVKRDLDDTEIASRVQWQLDDIKNAKERDKAETQRKERIETLRAGDLRELTDEDYEGDGWGECVEADATAFWASGTYVVFCKPIEENDATASPSERDDGNFKGDGSWAEREKERRAAETARQQVIENLLGDGYPDDPADIIDLVCRVFIADLFDLDAIDEVCKLLRLPDPPEAEGDDYDPNVRQLLDYVERGPDLMLRVAFAGALAIGHAGSIDFGRRALLRLLEAHGYQPTGDERALIDDTTIDLTVEDTADITTVGDENAEPGPAATPRENGADVDGEPTGSADELEANAAPAPAPEPVTTDTLLESAGTDVNDTSTFPVEGAAASSPPVPFKGYDSWTNQMVIGLLARGDTALQRAQAIHDYELANKRRVDVIDAAQAKIDLLSEKADA